MADKINILYIDDCLDPFITDYFLDEYKYQNIEIKYDELAFKVENNYEDLLNNEKVKLANIIVLDSALFQENNIKTLFTGEEFKIILKKYFPYIEVIIISQNTDINNYGIIEKYKESKNINRNFKEYYDEVLKPFLDNFIKDTLILRNILKKLNQNTELNEILKDKIDNSINGLIEYDELTSSDIDDLIEEFKKLEKNLKC